MYFIMIIKMIILLLNINKYIFINYFSLQIIKIKNNIKINKLHNYFLDMKNNCLKMGYLQNMSFYDFCCLIGEKNLFKK